MRILEAIHDFLPDHRAGSEIYTYNLSRALQARGHEVSLLFTEKRPEREQFSWVAGAYDGLPFHEIVYNRVFHDIADLYDDPRMEAPIGVVLDEVRPDAVHIQSLVYLGLGLVRACVARRIPMLMTLHEYFLACPRGGLLLDQANRLCDPIPFRECARCLAPYPIERSRYPDSASGTVEVGGCQPSDPLRFFERAARQRHRRMFEGVAPIARFIAPSAFLGERLIREGLDRRKVVVSDYGFPEPERVPRVPRAPGAPLRLGYLGTISDYKGVDLLVDAFAQLPRGAATCRIFGETSWFPDFTGPLLEKAKTLEGLVFEGSIPHGHAPHILAELDALIVPSRWYENSPLTLHEAFQCGVPVVTTDLGGMAELVQRGGGLLFQRDRASDLARVLRRLLDEPSLHADLVRSLPKVKSIAEDAAERERDLAEIVRSVSRGG